jgi:hypothetical protein
MVVFWIVSSFQLLLLMKTLPQDQDAMEAELDSYVRNIMATTTTNNNNSYGLDDSSSSSLVSIEDRRTFFDMNAARETVEYVRQGIQELRPPLSCRCNSENEETFGERSLWMNNDMEDTPLIVV